MNTNKQHFSVILAYLSMIIIWSTTPLAIKWSSYGLDFITGVSARMLIGSIIATALCFFFHKELILNKKSIQVYFASSISIYGSMMLVYYGAQFISSGLVSVIFGLSPIVTSWLAIQIFSSEEFNLHKLLGSISGILGLAYVFSEQIQMGEYAIKGMICILLAVVLHAISAIWIKQIDIKLPALSITTGGLLFSLPVFILTFFLFSPALPNEIPIRTLSSIIYLGIMGSVIGFMSYYYVLSHLNASTVALATLITPITALLLGNLFNQEIITSHTWVGTTLIIGGLVIYQYKHINLFNFLHRNSKVE